MGGIVDENVERTEFGGNPVEQRSRKSRGRQIDRQGQTALAQRFDLGQQVIGTTGRGVVHGLVVGHEVGEGNVGPSGSEATNDCRANSDGARGTGHQGNPSREWSVGHLILLLPPQPALTVPRNAIQQDDRRHQGFRSGPIGTKPEPDSRDRKKAKLDGEPDLPRHDDRMVGLAGRVVSHPENAPE
jgi:hypothetical protein